MTQLLAIEWDAREARIALGRTRGKELTVEQAFAVPLGTRDEGANAESFIAERITDALRRFGLGRFDTLIAIGRANIELRQLSVPPAPADELPEIVRFQAMRQFTTIGEDWPLDFVQLASGEADTVSVLAAAISPDVVRQILGTCESSNLVPRRIVLRPFAAASLLRRRDHGSRQPCRLMVDLLMEEADLSVLDDEHMLLTRTVRLSSLDDREAQAKGLLGEIRRTIAAANNQLGGRRVERVILCGDGAEHATIKKLVEQELALPVELFDPFNEMRLGPELADKRPEQAGRFAPLLGLLVDEASGAAHAIDFLHPRKKPEAVNKSRRNVLVGATLAAACLAAVALVWFQLSALDDEIARLSALPNSMKKDVKDAEMRVADAKTVQSFLDHNINYLDELVWLSEQLPSSEDIIVTQVNFASASPSGGQLTVEGFMRESDQFKDIAKRLRTENRTVKTDVKTDDPKGDRYKYGWKVAVKIPVGQDSKGKASRAPSKVAVPAAKPDTAASASADPQKGVSSK